MRLSDLLIRVLCVASVLLYTASATLIANRQTHLPQDLVLNLIKLEDGNAAKFTASNVREEFLLEKVSSKINSIRNLFKLIGQHTLPIQIILDFDHPSRVSVGAVDVTIGSSAVLADGQLEHALLKSWILQKGSSQVLVNPLRVEVGADLLLAAYSGNFKLVDPDKGSIATFSPLTSWTQDLLGEVELCNSAWKPAELISYCRGVVQNKTSIASSPFSLRKVIGSLIWKDLSTISMFNRKGSLLTIAQALQQSGLESQSSDVKSLSSLSATIQSEARQLYPSLQSSLEKPDLSTVVKRNDRSLLLSGFEVQADEVVQAPKVIVETCAAPSVSQLLKMTNEKNEHILFVQNCGELQVRYDGFASEGIKKFAMQNRSISFAYLHRESLKLASKLLNNFDVITAMNLETSTKDAKFLGLDQKIFKEDANAYKVNGPIGVIEWYRPIPNGRESRS